MGDNELNGTPEGVTPDGASEQNAASQLQDQQNAGQYGQQTNPSLKGTGLLTEYRQAHTAYLYTNPGAL